MVMMVVNKFNRLVVFVSDCVFRTYNYRDRINKSRVVFLNALFRVQINRSSSVRELIKFFLQFFADGHLLGAQVEVSQLDYDFGNIKLLV